MVICLKKSFQGQGARQYEDLVSLPGVGRKTANVVLSNAFDVLLYSGDTHVFRSNRIGLAKPKTWRPQRSS